MKLGVLSCRSLHCMEIWGRAGCIGVWYLLRLKEVEGGGVGRFGDGCGRSFQEFSIQRGVILGYMEKT